MKKLVCESLPEYEFEQALLEADGESKNMVHGAYKYVKTIPARELRKARAKSVMNSYKKKLINRINKILPKYKPNIVSLLDKTGKRIAAIPTDIPVDQIRNQKHDILSDLTKNLQTLLDSIKDAMQGQLKVYADSLHDRIERAGTITGVKFYPEEKTALLSRWRAIEDDVNKHIQNILINLVDSPEISQFQQIKAELEDYISKMRSYHSNLYDEQFDDDSDESLILTGSEDEKALKLLKQLNIEFDKPYFVIDRSYFEDPKPARDSYIMFKIDDTNGKIYYINGIINSKNKQFSLTKTSQKIYLVRKNKDWKTTIENIELGIKK